MVYSSHSNQLPQAVHIKSSANGELDRSAYIGLSSDDIDELAFGCWERVNTRIPHMIDMPSAAIQQLIHNEISLLGELSDQLNLRIWLRITHMAAGRDHLIGKLRIWQTLRQR